MAADWLNPPYLEIPGTPPMFNPALQALVSGDGSAAGFSARNTIVLFGDSITNNNNINNGLAGASNVTTQEKLGDRGWFTWANINLGAPFKVVRNSARSGDTTGDMLSRLAADVLAYSPAWVLLAGGINDRTLSGGADLGYAYTVANLQSMTEQCLAAGSKVLLATILPNNYVNGLGAGHTKVETLMLVNDWIRRYAETKAGVVCLDIFSAIYDQATQCGAISGSLGDQTHPSVAGANRIGVAVARMLTGFVKPRPVLTSLGDVASATNPYGNLIRYSTMSGTGGTAPATYVPTGTVPDGWWLQDSGAVANAGHTAVMTRPARTDYPGQTWWQSVVSWTAAQNTVCTFTHRLLSGSTLTLPTGVAAGDTVDCAIEMEFANVTNAGPMSLEFVARQGTTDLATCGMQYDESATTPEPAFAGVVRADGFVLPAGTDNILVRVLFRNLAGTVGGYTLRLGHVMAKKRR